MAKAYYLLASVLGGATVLAMEVLAARMMAPALGTGPVAWSALLAVALGMLAVGNLVGGMLSDRLRIDAVVGWALVVASVALVLLSQTYGPAMRWSAGRSLLVGSLAAALLTQAVPLGMLGAITPAIIRLPRGEGSSGPWTGVVLAAGCSGGILGALFTSLLLLPGVGITRSLLLLAATLALVAIPGACRQRRRFRALAAAISLLAVVLCWCRYVPKEIIQSHHGQLEIETTPSGSVLRIDGLPQTGLPDEIRPGDGLWHGYLLEAALMMRPQTRSALVIGLGAGLAPRLLEAHGLSCDTVEIDPAVVSVARERFGYDGRTIVGDGRTFLAGTSRRWDLIFLDVCTSDRLAWHLFTIEAMQTFRQRLAPSGILVIQFIGDDGPWSASLARTVEAVFGHGLMLVGADQWSVVGPRWLFATRQFAPRLPDAMFFQGTPVPWEEIRLEAPGRLLRDDHFPAGLQWARTALQWRRLYAGRP